MIISLKIIITLISNQHIKQMKNLKKITFLVACMTLFSISGFAQNSSLTIYNESECYIRVIYAEASDCAHSTNCGVNMSGAPICIAPQSSTVISPCAPGNGNYEWTMVTLQPADIGCGPCDLAQEVFRASSCTSDQNAVWNRCKCGTVGAAFTDPVTVVIQ